MAKLSDALRVCEVCGTSKGQICGKNGKHKIDLCGRHRRQMFIHGKISDRTIHDPNKLTIKDDIVEIMMYNIKNEVTGITIVDKKNIGVIGKYKWHIDANGYVRCGGDIILHRLITNAPKGMYVDHVNHNTLDNRECNLRVCTSEQNQYNQTIGKNNKSGVTGVHWRERDKIWVARIRTGGVEKYLGGYKDLEEAIEARMAAVNKYHGEFAYKGDAI